MRETFGSYAFERQISIVVISNNDSLLTIEAFEEMLELHELIMRGVMLPREEVRTETGEILFAAGVPAYHVDLCM